MPRIEMGVTDEIYKHLRYLARLGIHGATPEQCALHLLKCEMERLVVSGILPIQASPPPEKGDEE